MCKNYNANKCTASYDECSTHRHAELERISHTMLCWFRTIINYKTWMINGMAGRKETLVQSESWTYSFHVMQHLHAFVFAVQNINIYKSATIANDVWRHQLPIVCVCAGVLRVYGWRVPMRFVCLVCGFISTISVRAAKRTPAQHYHHHHHHRRTIIAIIAHIHVHIRCVTTI